MKDKKKRLTSDKSITMCHPKIKRIWRRIKWDGGNIFCVPTTFLNKII